VEDEEEDVHGEIDEAVAIVGTNNGSEAIPREGLSAGSEYLSDVIFMYNP